MTTNCKEELLNCISRYREELAENKAAIKQTLTSDKINISDYFYQGEKICDKELFNVGESVKIQNMVVDNIRMMSGRKKLKNLMLKIC